MVNAEKFSKEIRKFLLEKRKEKKLDLTESEILNTRLSFQEIDGELRYFIDENIVNILPKELIDKIEAIWEACKI